MVRELHDQFCLFFSGVKGEPGNAGPPGKDGLKGDTGETGTFEALEKVYTCFQNPSMFFARARLVLTHQETEYALAMSGKSDIPQLSKTYY